MEPQDCKSQVTAFGVHFIHEKDIMRLRKLNDSTTKLIRHVFDEATLYPPGELPIYMDACKQIAFFRSSINHEVTRSITFICDCGKQHYTLEDMHKIIKHLIEINQEVLSLCKEEWSSPELLPLFYGYYRIIQVTYDLYKDFLALLKDASDSWLSAKLALEQIVTKSRTCKDYSYREMLEQLNDLEAAEGIRFCNNFITSFAFFCKQTVSFPRKFNKHIQDIEKFKTLVKVSSITHACIFCVLVTYMCADDQLQEIKLKSSNDIWLDLIYNLSNQMDRNFLDMRSYGRELRIGDFVGCAVVLQELKMKMALFNCFTCKNEEEMMIVINKIEKMIDNFSVTIEDMRKHAHLYSRDIREAGNTMSQSIVDSNLQLTIASVVTGVQFMPPNKEKQNENILSEAMSVLYRATLSLTLTDLHWYMRACEEEPDDSSLLSCHSIIHDNTISIIKKFCDHKTIRCRNSPEDIYQVIKCLHAINQEGFVVLSECKVEWRHHPQLFPLVNDYHKICLQTSQLYHDFVKMLKGECDSWLSLILTAKEFGVTCRQDDDYVIYIKDMIFHNHSDDRGFTVSGDFMESLAYICKLTIAFTRQFKEETHNLKSVKVLAKISSGITAGVFCVMAACMFDPIPFKWVEEKNLTCVWLHLTRSFLQKSPSWKGEQLVIKNFLEIDSLLSRVRHKISKFYYPSKQDMRIVLNSIEKEINKLSLTIEDMSRHADKYSDDIIKAGISLELVSHNHMLPIKRKC